MKPTLPDYVASEGIEKQWSYQQDQNNGEGRARNKSHHHKLKANIKLARAAIQVLTSDLHAGRILAFHSE